ncbi:hypothetical protein PLICRDRAFT_44328 [Plicaturopsis crispa FD-325 SS-3]|nr:hypothetical protein PLICRDRAFT_44328 [Plicaturopsis crispa FD-325 SS-3]
MTPPSQSCLSDVQALIFDLMGTCTDWHTSILTTMRRHPPLPPSVDLSTLASDWRAGFFSAIFASFDAGEASPDIDIVHARVLDTILRERNIGLDVWDSAVRQDLVRAWHTQYAWSDSVEGIQRLKQRFMVVVLANGTTRLQLDIVRSSGLPFHTLFSSQLLGLTKPDPAMYLKALELMGIQPSQAAMVAAHAYDLRAAAKIGMKTVYIHRTTEDLTEDMDAVKADSDVFIDGRGAGGGLLELARVLDA